MSQIVVPAARPYVGLHRAPDSEPRPVGENTRERRPYTLADWERETRNLNGPAGATAAGRVVWGY